MKLPSDATAPLTAGRVHSGYQQMVPLSHPLTIAVHAGNQQVVAMKQRYIHQRKRPWIRCGLAGAITRGTYTIK